MSETILRQTTITLEPRPDGGLRIYSDELQGLILSGRDPALVIGDLLTAIRTLQEFNGPEGIADERQ